MNRFVAEQNADPKPFVWTADPDRLSQAQTPNVGFDSLEPDSLGEVAGKGKIGLERLKPTTATGRSISRTAFEDLIDLRVLRG